MSTKAANVAAFVSSQGALPFANQANRLRELVGLILFSITICLSNMGGVSGATKTVPIIMLMNDFDIKQAVPITSIVSACSSMLRYIVNFN